MEIELVEEKINEDFIGEVQVEQGSEEWFILRLERLTGSLFPSLMKTPSQKLEWTDTQMKIINRIACQILTGEREEFYTSTEMQWGTDHEAEAREYYEFDTMQVVRESGFWIISQHLGDSPDGIIEATKKVWECKCPASTTHLAYYLKPESLFNKYKWQCYGHMWATGYKEGDIISYDPRFPENKRMVVYSFKQDDMEMLQLQDRMAKAVKILKEIIA